LICCRRRQLFSTDRREARLGKHGVLALLADQTASSETREHLAARGALEVFGEVLDAVRRMIGGRGQDSVLGVGQFHVGSPWGGLGGIG
jgi:hypothetical protein